MKKIISIILILSVILCLASCVKQEDSKNTQTVVFYKDGMKTEVKDNDLYLEIVNVIESWYKTEEHYEINLAATTDLINEMRSSEKAIELPCIDEIKFPYGVSSGITVFIPLTGEYENYVFRNSVNSPDYWGGPIVGGKGLEKFFDGVKFTPLSEEEKRWRSTTNTPGSIEFYENGKLVGESGGYLKDYAFNNKVALHIESWFYKKENIETITISDIPIEDAWRGETYIKMWFGESPKIYGEQIIDKSHSYVVIPITGDYAYNIFSGTYEQMSSTMIAAQGHDLEQFFDEFKDNNN